MDILCFPLEIIRYIVLFIKDLDTLSNVLISNSIFRESLSKKDLLNKIKEFFCVKEKLSQTGWIKKYQILLLSRQKHGQQKWFDQDGILRATCIFRYGKRHGKYIEWNDEGVVIRTCKFYQGFLDGFYSEWLSADPRFNVETSAWFYKSKKCEKWWFAGSREPMLLETLVIDKQKKKRRWFRKLMFWSRGEKNKNKQ